MRRGISAAAAPSVLGFGEGSHCERQRLLAFAICLFMTGVTAFAIRFGSIQGPELKPFLPIVATTWALADLMTGFLLLAQFSVDGTTFLAALSAAYVLSGLLTWPYLFAFPGLIDGGKVAVPDQQISVCLWVIWHAVFPVIVGASVLWDSTLKPAPLSRVATRKAVSITLAVTLAVVAAVTAFAFGDRAALPHMISNGHLEFPLTHVAAPLLLALNLIGCAALLRGGRNMPTLHVWLVVAMFTALLDSLLNATSPSRYSYGWYAGKLETVATASVVLTVLLVEMTGVYRRLAEMAMIDTLTQLFNRRALEAHMRLVVAHAKRKPCGLGVLMVDVDFFKGYNDAYGHAAGDECLRRVAAVLKATATRPLDHVSRYGGEEFVVVLPETPRDGTITVARRILEHIKVAAIPYAAYRLGYVTVSVGIGFAANAHIVAEAALFKSADVALYEAKGRGRNAYAISDSAPIPLRVVPSTHRDVRSSFGM